MSHDRNDQRIMRRTHRLMTAVEKTAGDRESLLETLVAVHVLTTAIEGELRVLGVTHDELAGSRQRASVITQQITDTPAYTRGGAA